MNKTIQLLRSSFVVSLLALPLAVSFGCSSRSSGGDGVPASQTQNNGGGGGGGGGGVFESSADDSKKLSELSETEQGQLCSEYQAYFRARISDDDLTRLTCYAFTALFGSEDGASCEQSAQSCISSGGFEGEGSDDCDAAPFEMCDATVAELEDCYTGSVEAIDALIPRLSCDLFSDPSVVEGLNGRPASCDAIEARCPGFLDSEDDSNNGNNGGNFDSSVIIVLDGEAQEDFGWTNSGTDGNQSLMLRLDPEGNNTIGIEISTPSVPATLDMDSVDVLGQATVVLTLDGVEYVNAAGDDAAGILSVDDDAELGPQISFDGEVINAEGESLRLTVMFDGF